jgi:hypothetical protein
MSLELEVQCHGGWLEMMEEIMLMVPQNHLWGQYAGVRDGVLGKKNGHDESLCH